MKRWCLTSRELSLPEALFLKTRQAEVIFSKRGIFCVTAFIGYLADFFGVRFSLVCPLAAESRACCLLVTNHHGIVLSAGYEVEGKGVGSVKIPAMADACFFVRSLPPAWEECTAV